MKYLRFVRPKTIESLAAQEGFFVLPTNCETSSILKTISLTSWKTFSAGFA
ncbi:hypothetical protein RB2083_4118 [Rhodobacteraceae bacterium HTCC2083]|nr:hypothetical protein RB2083_4118 [Rhodobacteraceae bacterium HTCC2083]